VQSGHTLLRCRVGAAQRFHRTQDALTGNSNRTHSLTGMSRNAPSGTEGQSLDVSRSLMALVMGSWNVGGTFFSSLITLLSYRKMILRSFSSYCRCSRLGPNCRQSTMQSERWASLSSRSDLQIQRISTLLLLDRDGKELLLLDGTV
jgi:hypothetical protein